MRYSKLLAWAVMVAGVMVAGAQAKAEEPRWEHRDQRAERRYDIAADRARLNEALRCGRFAEAAAIRRDIARDEAELRFRRR